jgi:hypothetical protein
MTEPKDLLLLVEQLRRSNRRWRVLALAACAVVILVALFGVMMAQAQRMRAEAVLSQALVEARQARVDAQRAVNPGQ